MADHELGIFFSLKESSGRRYEAEAWEVFMRHADPGAMRDAELFQGEVPGLLPGSDRMFCIAVRTKDLIVVQYLKDIFASCNAPHLAPAHDRIREAGVIEKYDLSPRGRIDSAGRLVTDEWSRLFQHLCKVTGWPYLPLTYPTHLRQEKLDELEAMSEPGRRKPEYSNSLPGLKPLPSSEISSVASRRFRGIAAFIVIVLILCALLVLGWLARGRISEFLGERKEKLSMKLDLGSEAYEKVQEGFALVEVKNVPHDLDLAVLNEKMSDRAYYFLHHKEESVYDVKADCMVWYAPSEKQVPSPETTMQAFIKINLKSRKDYPVWACQSKGVRSSPGTEKENPNLRRDALLAAIENMDLTCLADGRSVKSFQANNDFPGLNKHIQYLLATCNGSSSGSSNPGAQEGAVVTGGTRLERQNLEAELRKRLANEWIMSNRVYLKNGQKFGALVLGERGLSLDLRSQAGTTRIPKAQIEKVEAFGAEQYAKEINLLLESQKKRFTHEWQHKLCDELVDELAARCMTYGPPFPGVFVLEVKPDNGTSDASALLLIGTGRRTVKNGDKVAGFKVIGIDAETNTVLVRMGPKGDILRIWPKTVA